MAIYQDIPQPGDILAVSQVDLEQNFTYLSQALAKDLNIAFNTDSATTNVGYSKKTTYMAAASNNIAMPGSADSMTFSFGGDLYWKNPLLAAAVKMTNSSGGAPVADTFGYSFLPGGMLIQWGKSVSANAPLLANFPVPFSGVPYSVTTTVSSATANQLSQVTASNAASFTFAVYTANTATITPGRNVFWLAIGPG